MQAGAGVVNRCPDGYIATAKCGSGGMNDCGTNTVTRLRCCKIKVKTVKKKCKILSTSNYGENLECPEKDGQLTFITDYCGSSDGKHCNHGKRVNTIKCCVYENLVTGSEGQSKAVCLWKHGDYGVYLRCPTGFAMTGSCGSGENRDCTINSLEVVHGIKCCKVE